MAQEYAKVLLDLNVEFRVIGRGESSAASFEDSTGVKPFVGGLSLYSEENDLSEISAAVVATGVEQLMATSLLLMDLGVKRLLVEKPAGLDLGQIKRLSENAQKHAANIFVAYNRRFYESVNVAREMIEKDGGVRSFNFEVTEWGHVIEKIHKAEGVKEHWFLANSSHIVDLAFFLGGKPREISTYSSGSLSWHPSASNFSGAGISHSDALFSYRGDWAAPGRWSVEVLTAKHKFILCPVETLQIQKIGSVSVEPVDIEESFDKKFKPGLYKQLLSFINGEYDRLCSLEEHFDNSKVYSQMAGYL